MPRYHQPSQAVRLRRSGASEPLVRRGFRPTQASAATAVARTRAREATKASRTGRDGRALERWRGRTELADGRQPTDTGGTLIVDLLDGSDHPLDAEPFVHQLPPGPGQGIRQGMIREEPDDRRRQGRRIVRRDEKAR